MRYYKHKLYLNDSNKGKRVRTAAITILVVLTVSGCAVFEQTVRSTINDAVGAAIEQELGSRIAGYTDVMMWQLAYTQAFYMGGYGFTPGDFEEGQGATWRIEAVDRDDISSFTAERALLKRNEDGSTWWYLKFDADEAEPVEYEVRLSTDFVAREMYVRDPETREVRYHEFTFDDEEVAEADRGDESIEEIGYQTGYFYTEAWDQYRERSERITTGAGSFDTELLLFTAQDAQVYVDDDETDYRNVEYRWWVSRDVPGELVRFEYRDLDDDGMLRGELISLRDDYRARFADL
ncbi:MAG: hypothetical protein EA363_08540 [Balneolaceae bacterium]|nr:MAG: hypothetical protein EA363_08540 [Balneolaceae bacterium]